MSETRVSSQSVPRELERSLLALRTRQSWLARAEGKGVASALLLTGIGLLGWTDFLIDLPAGLRLAGMATLALGSVLGWVLSVRAGRSRSAPNHLAAALD